MLTEEDIQDIISILDDSTASEDVRDYNNNPGDTWNLAIWAAKQFAKQHNERVQELIKTLRKLQ